jgi:preprotein translocase subunit YajC
MTFLSLLGIEDAMAAATQAGQAGAATQSQGSVLQALLVPVLLIVVFYFLLIRPQSKRAKEQRSMLEKITIGDEIMTSGGILGRVVRLRDQYVVVKIARDVEVTIQKGSIATVLPKGSVETLD